MQGIKAVPTIGLRLVLLQKIILVAISIMILAGSPIVWDSSPDAGIYIGSAIAMLEEGQYWFNGYPNLLYYPGTSALLTLPLSVFGLDFQILHLTYSFIGISILWFVRSFYSPEQYGWTGLLLPILLGFNSLYLRAVHHLDSDMIFLGLVILAITSWTKFVNSKEMKWFYVATLVVALAPLVRFHGLFLVGGFGLAVLVNGYQNRHNNLQQALFLLALSALTLLPFLGWTIRNIYQHTGETYNMANFFFFGLKGAAITSSPDVGVPDWIDADWKYPVYQIMYLFGGLGNSFIDGLSEYVPLEIVTAVVLGLFVTGISPWLRSASIMEIVFVSASTLILVDRSVGGKSLYIITRYWVPLLPFFILISGLGISSCRTVLEKYQLPSINRYVPTAFVSFLIVAGIFTWMHRLSDEYSLRLTNKDQVVTEVTKFVRENVPERSVIIGTDWGAVPLLTERRAFQVMRSSCTGPTLKIIRDNDIEYLVVLPKFLRTDLSVQLVEEYPLVFQLLYSKGNKADRSFGAVYEIDRNTVEAAFENSECREKYRKKQGQP